MTTESFQLIRNWMYRNARPLDLARWQYHFENGNNENVLNALTAYQNEDGGFGHALEADSWNPNSSPLQTWTATEILREVHFADPDHSIIKGILAYLDKGADFNGRVWCSTVQSNNDYPHAPWWHTDSESTSHTDYNPTASLAGFGLCYSKPDSSLHQKCTRIAEEAVEVYLSGDYLKDMHTVSCYIQLMNYCKKAGAQKLFDLDALQQKLRNQVQQLITYDTSIWRTSYVCKPSQLFNSPDSLFYEDNKKIADFECDYIDNSRNNEGIWDITWKWDDYADEWAISRNWWKGNLVVLNMLYLKNFGKL